jgi:predicted RNA-binding protein with PIN domain
MPVQGRPAILGGSLPDVNQTRTMAKSFLLVDAHNVIFARPDLASLHRQNRAAAREKLLQILEHLQDAGDTRVVAVFDGAQGGRPEADFSGASGVQVFYSQSADAVIERLVVKYAATHRLTVATDDNLIRTAAIAAGASTIGVEQLFREITSAEKELGETLKKLRRKR